MKQWCIPAIFFLLSPLSEAEGRLVYEFYSRSDFTAILCECYDITVNYLQLPDSLISFSLMIAGHFT